MSNQRVRLPAELETKLREQLGFIRKSCDLYDAGDEAEADRIAVSLRVLFHQTESSHSLMKQLGMTNINMRSSHDPRRMSPSHNHLIRISIQAVPVRVWATPFLDESLANVLVRLNEWWDVEPVYNLGDRNATRRMHVASLANKDGAHVDPSLSELDEKLRTFGLALTVVEPWEGCEAVVGEDHQAKNALRASVRQIGYEVLGTPAFRSFLN